MMNEKGIKEVSMMRKSPEIPLSQVIRHAAAKSMIDK